MGDLMALITIKRKCFVMFFTVHKRLDETRACLIEDTRLLCMMYRYPSIIIHCLVSISHILSLSQGGS